MQNIYNTIIRTTYVDDKIHGLYIKSTLTNTILVQTNYVNGEIMGEYKEFYENGQLKIYYIK